VELLAEKSALFGPDLLAQSTGAQFGGEVVDYEQGLSFVTVHGVRCI
jgi:serine carboxypeptidase-like clade I